MVYDFFDTKCIGSLILAGDDQGIRHIQFERSRLSIPIQKDWKRDPGYFKNAKSQLQAYFNRELKQFDLPLAPAGTEFQQMVWRVLQQIPYGTVTSYQWVAKQIGNPNAVRAVGGANGRNPIAIVIPCHRVIGKDGSLTGFGGGLDVKQKLIDLEKQKV